MAEHQVLAKFFRPFAVLLLVAFVILLTAYGALSGYTNSRVAAVKDDWARQFGTLEEALARFPPRDSNAAALELEALVARLGISIAPRGLRTPPGLDRETSRPFIKVWNRGPLQPYFKSQLEKTGGPIDAPEPQLREWLLANRDALDHVVAFLLEGDTPRWMLHLDELHQMQIPNLLGHLQIQKVLLTDALMHLSQGDEETALERIEAGWRLNRSIADDPVLITQLIALSVFEFQVATLRHVASPPPVWKKRLDHSRIRERLLHALELQAWQTTRLDEPPYGWSDNPVQQAATRLFAPYTRLCFADASSRLRVAIERVKGLDYLCDRDPRRCTSGAIDRAATLEPFRWNDRPQRGQCGPPCREGRGRGRVDGAGPRLAGAARHDGRLARKERQPRRIDVMPGGPLAILERPGSRSCRRDEP